MSYGALVSIFRTGTVCSERNSQVLSQGRLALVRRYIHLPLLRALSLSLSRVRALATFVGLGFVQGFSLPCMTPLFILASPVPAGVRFFLPILLLLFLPSALADCTAAAKETT